MITFKFNSSYSDCIKWTSFETTWSFNCVPMHGITHPSDNKPSLAHCPYKMWKLYSHVIGTHSRDYCQSSRFVPWVENFTQLHKVLRVHFVTNLYDAMEISATKKYHSNITTKSTSNLISFQPLTKRKKKKEKRKKSTGLISRTSTYYEELK